MGTIMTHSTLADSHSTEEHTASASTDGQAGQAPKRSPSASTERTGRTLGEHDAFTSVCLHLLPGVLTGAVFFALRPLVVAAGYPPRLALVLAIPLALLPVILGLLLYVGHRQNGRFSLEGVVLYRERIPFQNYFAYVPTVFVAGITVFVIGGMVLDEPLRAALFGWMPSLDWGLGSSYSRGVLVVTFALAALFVLLLESALEEIYFRGFLLPRMGYAGRWAVPLHSLLFALHHLWMPWRIVSLAVGILPLVFAVRRTRNIYVGIIPHMLSIPGTSLSALPSFSR
jgi:uncharacterized protein